MPTTDSTPLKVQKSRIDLTGQRFGLLTVLHETARRGRYKRYWQCRCDCGNVLAVAQSSLCESRQTACGCQKTSHNHTGTRVYKIWDGMKQRCGNPNDPMYPRYGGRGVTICERWLDFSNFLADMGEPPSSRHSIDRIDNNAGYFPANCRWATSKEQARNRHGNLLLTFKEQTRTLSEWGELTGIPPSQLSKRIKRLGWSVEKALTTPLQAKRR
jgi:hypothetical protein